MDNEHDLVARITAFLDGRTDRIAADESVPAITPEMADQIAKRVDAMDWFLVFYKDHQHRSRAAGPAPTPASVETGDTILSAPKGDQLSMRYDALVRDLDDAVVRVVDQLITGPDGETLLLGVDTRENKARRRLARAVAERMWGTDRLPKELALIYWPAVAGAIRMLLLRWAEYQRIDEGDVKDTPGVERANGHSLVFPKMERPADWVAADALCITTRAENPVAADVFELHTYAGLASADIAKLRGVTKEEVSDECKLLEAELYAEPR